MLKIENNVSFTGYDEFGEPFTDNPLSVEEGEILIEMEEDEFGIIEEKDGWMRAKKQRLEVDKNMRLTPTLSA